MGLVFLVVVLHAVHISLAVNCTFDSQQQTVWREQEFPDPRIDLSKCGLCYNSVVCDPNSILSTYEEEQLNDLLLDISRYTTCPSSSRKNTFFVAIVKELEKYGRSMSRDELQERVIDFTEYLLETKWNLGECGGVIFVSEVDRKVYTVTGSRVKTKLTDSCIQHVYEDIKPHLSTGNYYAGLRSMIRQYEDILQRDITCPTRSGSSGEEENLSWIAAVVIAGLVVIGVGVGCFLRLTGRGCQGGGGGGSSYGGHHHHHHHHHGGGHWHSGGDSGGGGGGGGGGSDSCGGGGGDF